jgi:hypothetical protein
LGIASNYAQPKAAARVLQLAAHAYAGNVSIWLSSIFIHFYAFSVVLTPVGFRGVRMVSACVRFHDLQLQAGHAALFCASWLQVDVWHCVCVGGS